VNGECSLSPATIIRYAHHHTVEQCGNEEPGVPKEIEKMCKGSAQLVPYSA